MIEAQKMHKEYNDKMDDILKSSYEHFDRALLTLSSGGLGLSILYISNFGSKHQINSEVFIIIAWILFCISIVSTLLSLIFSQEASKKYKMYSDMYYIEGNEEFVNKKNCYSIATTYLNYFSGGSFLFAVIFMLIFVSNNFLKGDEKMEKTTNEIYIEEKLNNSKIGGIVPPKMQLHNTNTNDNIEKGIVPTKLPKKPIEKPSDNTQNQPVKKK